MVTPEKVFNRMVRNLQERQGRDYRYLRGDFMAALREEEEENARANAPRQRIRKVVPASPPKAGKPTE
jgi:hypothetical protein